MSRCGRFGSLWVDSFNRLWRMPQNRSAWPDPQPVRQWQKTVRARLERIGATQAQLAEICKISPKTLECWLADPEKSWHRTPSYLEKYGLSFLLTSNLTMAVRRHDGPHHKKRRERLASWPGRSKTDIARDENLTLPAVDNYCRKHGIETL